MYYHTSNLDANETCSSEICSLELLVRIDMAFYDIFSLKIFQKITSF